MDGIRYTEEETACENDFVGILFLKRKGGVNEKKMGRKPTQILDYWQFEVGLFDDVKMVDLNEKYGTLGEAVYFRILSYIAKSNGYYAVLSDSLILSIYRSIGSKWLRDKRVILRIIHYCGECGLFDVNLLSQNVITSSGIQRRWLYAKEKSRSKGFTTTNFWLLDSERFDCCTQNENKCATIADKCSNNSNKCDNNEPYISKVKKREETPNPLQGGGIQNWKEKFFSTYTAFEKKNYKDDGVDYEILYSEFQKSSMLRQLFSFPRVVKIYPNIAKGEYRDKQPEQQKMMIAVDERAERERYYSELQSKAQAIADRNLKRAKQIPRFAELTKEFYLLEKEIAKAEIYQTGSIQEIQLRQLKVVNEKEELLKNIGLTLADIKPKYFCKKCNDTGWQRDGKSCDCYPKTKGES